MGASAQRLDDQLADGAQGLENALPLDGHGLKVRDSHGVQYGTGVPPRT